MPGEMQQQWDSSWLDSGNQTYLENQFETYLQDPGALSEEWRAFFQSLTADAVGSNISHAKIREFFKSNAYGPKLVRQNLQPVNQDLRQAAVQNLITAYRLYGHKYSEINPLAPGKPDKIAELEIKYYGLTASDLHAVVQTGNFAGNSPRTIQQIITELEKVYCGSVAAEFMHISAAKEREWVQSKYESILLDSELSQDKKIRILELVVAADGLEKYLGAKYPGAKRFSLEGCDSLIVALDELIQCAGGYGVDEVVMAMSHRGRLNVLVNLMGKLPRELFDQFEDKHNTQLESGDVKYHQGFSSDLATANGNMHLSLIFNPSHLEIVTPVATGSVRARQERRDDEDRNKVICIAMHGDAAFAGQGIVMETLNMSNTRAYGIGGTIHIIVNNQIGFTTSNPRDARSTSYASDIGKMLEIPIFHVNADDPQAMCSIARLAIEYRMNFHKDVIIDIFGYRRMGHNEADEPSATQPLMYKKIRSHPSVKQLYAEKLIQDGMIDTKTVEEIADKYRHVLDQRDRAVVEKLEDDDWRSGVASDWTPYNVKDWRFPVNTGVPQTTLEELANKRDTPPQGFMLDPRVKKIVEERQKMTRAELKVDWGYAETLAYATLLHEGYGVRLTGQDCGRGTFFHRHAVWHDQNNGATYISLSKLHPDQGKFSVYDSLLSEAGVLAFEYGYSTSEPRTLTLWEAQFGDFANGAQVVIDQFISSGEQKWGRLSGLVLLLPHGYEGQGPEHSSARIERYLQACAQHNIQFCIPSTPAQMFHLLRRQILRPMRKPLVVITPKSLLRHKGAVSTLADLATGGFQAIIPDSVVEPSKVKRIVLCSGKVYYEVFAARDNAQKSDVAIIRMEQIYPFPEQELAIELKKYSSATEIVWCQEEPQNQGSWYSSQHHVRNIINPEQKMTYAGRPDSAAPAVGYFSLHEQQQKDLVNKAVGIEILKE